MSLSPDALYSLNSFSFNFQKEIVICLECSTLLPRCYMISSHTLPISLLFAICYFTIESHILSPVFYFSRHISRLMHTISNQCKEKRSVRSKISHWQTITAYFSLHRFYIVYIRSFAEYSSGYYLALKIKTTKNILEKRRNRVFYMIHCSRLKINKTI